MLVGQTKQTPDKPAERTPDKPAERTPDKPAERTPLISIPFLSQQPKVPKLGKDWGSDPTLFDSLKRIALETKAATEQGVSLIEFRDLLKKFNIEVTLLRSKVSADKDRETLRSYEKILEIYNDSSRVWNLDVSMPSIVQESENRELARLNTSALAPLYWFGEKAKAWGVPVDDFYGNPNFKRDLVKIYHLPIIEQGKWKFIPRESIQMIWRYADTEYQKIDPSLVSEK
jgi:hypothetical protein